MTKDPRLRRLVPSGQPRFVRLNPQNKTEGSDLNPNKDVNIAGKPVPATPDSGFSDGPIAVTSAKTNGKPEVQRSGYAEGDDFGTSSVIHVLEPDVSAARDWWHTKGYTSDPYEDGTLPIPSTPRSQAALEAAQVAKKAAEAKKARLKLQNPSADCSEIEPLLQSIPIRPTASREGNRPNTASPTKYEPSAKPKGQPLSKSLPEAEKPPSKITLKRSTSLPVHRNTPKASPGSFSGGRVGRKALVEIVEGDEHSPAGNKQPEKGIRTTNKITPPPRPPLATRLRQSQPPAIKGPSQTNNQDISGSRVRPKGRDRLAQRAGPIAKRPRPSSTPTPSTSLPHNTPQRIRKQTTNTSTQVQRAEKQSASSTTDSLAVRKQSTETAQAKTPSPRGSTILVKRTPRRQRFFSVPSSNEVSKENVEISRLDGEAAESKVDQRVKIQRRVSFITSGAHEREGEVPGENSRDGMGPEFIETGPGGLLPKRRQRKLKMVANKKGTNSSRRPTQRQMDNDIICDVALANRYSRMGNREEGGRSKEDNQISQVLSESEDEGEESRPIEKAKSCWELFEDQVKSIDDSSMYFSPRDLTSKSSDLFEKVMWQVGPQFRKTSAPEDPDIQTAYETEDGDTEGEDQFNEEEQKIARGPVSAMSRFKSRRGWGMLRKTVLDKQMEAAAQGGEASFNWSMLCTTIHHMTDMQKGREALYQKYIYEPNTWMKGFSTSLPTHVLKHTLRASKTCVSNKDIGPSMRGVQSANGQRTVVVGHLEDDQDPNNCPHPGGDLRRAKPRARSTQGRIRVAAAAHTKPAPQGLSKPRK